MRINELSDDQLYEMSDLGSRVTGLPDNCRVWVRAGPNKLPHSNYRVKIKKNNEWSAAFSIVDQPTMIEKFNGPQLSSREIQLTISFINQYKSLLISLIDAKITSDELSYQVFRDQGLFKE